MRGIIDLDALNAQLVEQDEELRARCIKAVTHQGAHEDRIESMLAALLDAQLAIHERQGNLLIFLLSNGGS